MYSTCLFCNSPLGTNEVIEAFPVGRRLAFDAARGRLWVVCRRCERWNLTPLEERWEAVEDCERRFRNARKRVSTDNIGLARLDAGVELVRIGEPLRPEFAAWRYGDQFGRRRRRAILLTGAGIAVAGAVVVSGIATGAIAGGGWQLFNLGGQILGAIRKRRLVARVPAGGGALLTVRGKHLEQVRLETQPTAESGWSLRLAHADGETVLTGPHAVHAAGLIMPKINSRGAGQRQVQAAVRRIEESGDPIRFLAAASREASYLRGVTASRRFSSKHAGTLPKLPVEIRLAIEMAANEENERAALEGELELLEMAWREAEEVADIADNLLLPDAVKERFERLRFPGQRPPK